MPKKEQKKNYVIVDEQYCSFLDEPTDCTIVAAFGSMPSKEQIAQAVEGHASHLAVDVEDIDNCLSIYTVVHEKNMVVTEKRVTEVELKDV